MLIYQNNLYIKTEDKIWILDGIAFARKKSKKKFEDFIRNIENKFHLEKLQVYFSHDRCRSNRIWMF